MDDGVAETQPPPPPPGATLTPGATLGRYRIEGTLGQGGMGAVYAATDTDSGQQVALKVLRPDLAAREDLVRRFTREGAALARIEHPHVVQLLAVEEAAGTAFIAMERVEGESLRERLKRGPFPPDDAVDLVLTLCGALAAVHAEGVVHRDLKPGNVLLASDGTAKLADFGLAKVLVAGADQETASLLTRTDDVLGTPAYMAPEQLEATSDVDERADIYSLGVVLYELLTGVRPAGRFEPPSAHCGCDPALDAVALRALEREPSRRFGSATDLAGALSAARDAGRPRVWRRRLKRALLALVALTILGGLAVGGWFYRSYVAPTSMTETGRTPLRWMREVRGCSDAVLGRDRLYVTTREGLTSFELERGVVRERLPGTFLRAPVTLPPGDRLLAFTSGGLQLLRDARGGVQVEHTLPGATTGGGVSIVDGVAYVSGPHVTAVDLSAGAALWSHDDPLLDGSVPPRVTGDQVILSGDRREVTLDRRSGKDLGTMTMTATDPHRIVAGPLQLSSGRWARLVAVGDRYDDLEVFEADGQDKRHLYDLGHWAQLSWLEGADLLEVDGRLVLCATDRLVGVDLRDDTLRWAWTVRFPERRRLVTGAVEASPGTVVALTRKGLALVRVADGRASFSRGPDLAAVGQAVLCASAGTAYVLDRDGGHVSAYDLEPLQAALQE